MPFPGPSKLTEWPNRRKFIFLVLPVMLFGNCRLAYRSVLGIDSTPEWQDEQDIKKKAKSYKIPTDELFLLDHASFHHVIQKRAETAMESLTTDGIVSPEDSILRNKLLESVNNDLQPVQVRYFICSGEPIFKLVNCYIDPPIPMNWNVEGCFDVFPPRPIAALKEEHNDSLQFFLPHITRMDGTAGLSIEDLPKADYYALIFWNSLMIKPSKKLIRQLTSYQRIHQNKYTYFIYVNNHNANLWSLIPDDQKSQYTPPARE